MVENSRKDPRAKVLSMTVRYKSATLDEFIEHHSHDVSRGGMYIKTPQPFPPGTLLKFEVKIGSDQRVIQGVGRVVWRRQSDEATESHPAGMGVKFIKLDEESKSTISQLVNARSSETSAFDEVAANSERPPASISEAPAQPAHSGSGNFFPPSSDDVPPPAREDRTVMKQAAELLQEALREVSSTSDSEPPTAKPDAVASPKPTRAATTTPAPGQGGRAARSALTAAKGPSNVVSTVPPAEAAAQASVAGRSGDASQAPRANTRAASRAPQRATGQPRTQSYSVGASRNPRDPLAIESAQSAAAGSVPVEQATVPRKSGGGGIRAVIMLLLVAGVAGAVFVFTRKQPPQPALPQPTPAVTTTAAELLPSASAAETAAVAPSASEVPSATASAEPSSTSAAAATGSEGAPAGSADVLKQAQPGQLTQEAEPKPKPVIRPRAPARKKQSTSTDTATTDQPVTAPETAPPKPAETETPKAPTETPTGTEGTSKPSSKTETTSGASKPSPKADTPTPTPPAQTDQL